MRLTHLVLAGFWAAITVLTVCTLPSEARIVPSSSSGNSIEAQHRRAAFSHPQLEARQVQQAPASTSGPVQLSGQLVGSLINQKLTPKIGEFGRSLSCQLCECAVADGGTPTTTSANGAKGQPDAAKDIRAKCAVEGDGDARQDGRLHAGPALGRPCPAPGPRADVDDHEGRCGARWLQSPGHFHQRPVCVCLSVCLMYKKLHRSLTD